MFIEGLCRLHQSTCLLNAFCHQLMLHMRQIQVFPFWWQGIMSTCANGLLHGRQFNALLNKYWPSPTCQWEHTAMTASDFPEVCIFLRPKRTPRLPSIFGGVVISWSGSPLRSQAVPGQRQHLDSPKAGVEGLSWVQLEVGSFRNNSCSLSF